MALDQTARAGMPGEPPQADYDAILDTMMVSARGRWFLTEFARRNRTADTTAAIDRIGAHLRGEALPPNAPEYLQLGLMAMAGLVAAVEADMSALSTGHETEDGARPRVRRVVGTLRDLGDCIQVMLDGFKPNALTTQAAAAPPAEKRVPPAPLTVIAAAEAAAERPAQPLPPLTLEPEASAATSEPDDLPPVAEYESDFVPFEFEQPEQANASVVTLPEVEPFAAPAGSEPAVPGNAFGDPLGEMRMLSQAELVALFS